ncbi:MAG: two-component system response regulator [Colwellia sp.]|nr:two-component system response regulator [Colwellia sp.]
MCKNNFRILVVDDNPTNIQLIAQVLKIKNYHIAYATSGAKALSSLKENDFDLVLLDVMMPGLNGYETCKEIKKQPKHEHLPIIFLTAKTDDESIIAGFDCGGVDYVAKPFNQRELLARIETHLKLKDYEDNLEYKVLQLTHEIEATQREVVFTMGAIGETRSKETGNHVKRVAKYSYLFAIKSGLSESEAQLLKESSPMHDIGKVGIPDSILNKPGKLTADEWQVMMTHAQIGYDMLKMSERPILKAAATVAIMHHEKYDGSGYPNGLAGEAIHIYGRITAISDVFDALGSARCYKEAWPDQDIFNLMKEERGKHFDPQLIDIFFENLDEFLSIRNNLKDSD